MYLVPKNRSDLGVGMGKLPDRSVGAAEIVCVLVAEPFISTRGTKPLNTIYKNRPSCASEKSLHTDAVYSPAEIYYTLGGGIQPHILIKPCP